MKLERGDRHIWTRLAVVASGVWLGIVVMLSATLRDFAWISKSYARAGDPGPAMITAIVGLAIVWILALGIPWIVAGTTRKD